MPKKRKQPETFDEWVGTTIESKFGKTSMRQDDLAAATGISVTLIGRSIRGTRGLSVKEFETIAGVLGEDPGVLLKEALDGFGGMEKLLTKPVSDVPLSLDEQRRRKQAEAAAMTPQQIAEYSGEQAAIDDPELEGNEPDPT